MTSKKKTAIKTTQCKLEKQSAEAMAALREYNNPPFIFVKGGRLVRIRQDEKCRILIDFVDERILANILERSASFVKLKNNIEVLCDAPLPVVRDILAMPQWRDIPPLVDVTETPILRMDGTILTTPGYDSETGIFYNPPQDFVLSRVPENPTVEEIFKARTLIQEMLAEFPFDTDADFCNAVALSLTPLVRPIIDGPIPLAVISAPQNGTGKTLIGEIVSLMATGHSPELMQFPTQEDEIRKKITAALMQSAQIIMWDNIKIPIDSSTLASALTCNEWGDRILGRSENVRLHQRATWIANGNNLYIGEELVRRSYPINLNAKMPKPYTRSGYLHGNITEWVLENRGRLMAAGFILVRAWINSGKSRFLSLPLGNFTEWVEITGGILMNAGFHNFLGNLNTVGEKSLTDQNQWRFFLSVLHAKFPNQDFSTAEFCEFLQKNPSRNENLPDEISQILTDKEIITPAQKTSIGRALRKIVEKRFGDEAYYLTNRLDEHKKVALWKVHRGDTGNCGGVNN